LLFGKTSKDDFLIRILYILLLNFPLSTVAGKLLYHQDSTTGLLSWQKVDAGFSLTLIQLLPDFVGATYGARGLPSSVVDEMMRYCVFGTIIRNESQHPLIYQVSDWRYIAEDGIERPIKTKTNWINEWKDLGVAFRWSILPDNQRLEVGDWNQGFTTFSLAPESTLDIIYSWRSEDEFYEAELKGLRCAPKDI